MEFKVILKELRMESGLTQEALGKRLNVSKMCISHWEKGNSEPDIAQLKALASIFSITVDYLIGYKMF